MQPEVPHGAHGRAFPAASRAADRTWRATPPLTPRTEGTRLETPCETTRHPDPARTERGRQGAVRFGLREAVRNLPARCPRLVRGVALGFRLVDAIDLLRSSLGAVGRPASRPVRSGGTALLHPGPGALSAGSDLPGGSSRAVGLGPFLLHRRCGASVVRLHLPANGLHRNLHVGGAQDRGRPDRTDAPRPGSVEREKTCAQDREAGCMGGDRAGHRIQFRGLLHPNP
jgi:hypothetical protein